jgi:hypothetical protein
MANKLCMYVYYSETRPVRHCIFRTVPKFTYKFGLIWIDSERNSWFRTKLRGFEVKSWFIPMYLAGKIVSHTANGSALGMTSY